MIECRTGTQEVPPATGTQMVDLGTGTLRLRRLWYSARDNASETAAEVDEESSGAGPSVDLRAGTGAETSEDFGAGTGDFTF